MIAKGRVQNGVVVLEQGVSLPEGREVTVIESSDSAPNPSGVVEVSPERRQALLDVIGMFKMDNPPDDAEVERILDEARMEKYG